LGEAISRVAVRHKDDIHFGVISGGYSIGGFKSTFPVDPAIGAHVVNGVVKHFAIFRFLNFCRGDVAEGNQRKLNRVGVFSDVVGQKLCSE
jgi:hypothetical protein